MDQGDKSKITNHLSLLISRTSFDGTLESKLLEKKIFTPEMIERFKHPSNTNKDNARQLFLEVPKRGPKAFKSLVSALAESGNVSAAKLLDPDLEYDVEAVNTNNNLKIWNEPNYENFTTTSNVENLSKDLYIPPPVLDNSTTPVEVRVRLAKTYIGPPNHRAYPIIRRPRGLALIIDNEDFQNNVLPKRIGSMVDANNLDILFEQLGFRVTLRRNLKYQEMMKELDGFSSQLDHRKADMCVVCILSHGRHGLVAAADGREIETEWVLRRFNNDGCPALKGKPKFFLLQACRGDEQDYGILPKIEFPVASDATDASSQNPPKGLQKMGARSFKEPTWEDMLIAYATLPGYVANRDIYRGTWFVECICQVFMEHAADTDIRDMLDEVAERLTRYESEVGTKQSFSYEVRHFYKKLYFNPGLYQELVVEQEEESEARGGKRRPLSMHVEELRLEEEPLGRRRTASHSLADSANNKE